MNPSPSASTGRPGRNFDGSKGRGRPPPPQQCARHPCSSLGSVSVHGRRRRIRQVGDPVRRCRRAGRRIAASRARRAARTVFDADLHIRRSVRRGRPSGARDKAERARRTRPTPRLIVVVVRLPVASSNSSSVSGPQHDGAAIRSIRRCVPRPSSSVARWRATSVSSTLGSLTGAASRAAYRRLRCGSDRRRRRAYQTIPGVSCSACDRQQGVRGTSRHTTVADTGSAGRTSAGATRPRLPRRRTRRAATAESTAASLARSVWSATVAPIMSVGHQRRGGGAEAGTVSTSPGWRKWRQRHRYDVGGHQVVRVGRVTDEHGKPSG